MEMKELERKLEDLKARLEEVENFLSSFIEGTLENPNQSQFQAQSSRNSELAKLVASAIKTVRLSWANLNKPTSYQDLNRLVAKRLNRLQISSPEFIEELLKSLRLIQKNSKRFFVPQEVSLAELQILLPDFDLGIQDQDIDKEASELFDKLVNND